MKYIIKVEVHFLVIYTLRCRSQRPRGLRRMSAAACLLKLWVRIPPKEWMSVLLSLWSLRRADHSSRGVLPAVLRRCVWSRNLVDEEALAQWWGGGGRLLRQKNIYITDLINVREMEHIKILLLLLVHPFSFPNKIQCMHHINLATYMCIDLTFFHLITQIIFNEKFIIWISTLRNILYPAVPLFFWCYIILVQFVVFFCFGAVWYMNVQTFR